MDLSALDPLALIIAMMMAATPLLLAATGELVVEKSGVLNLGVEGMMILGAISGFAVAVETQSAILGVVAGGIGGMGLALLFGILTQFLLSNQVATGLGLTLFGLGLSALIGQPYAGIKPPPFPALELGRYKIDAMIPISLLIVAAVAAFLARTRTGLTVRAVGENHDAAHALGYDVVGIRFAAIAFGGACAGLGGAYLSLVRVPQWTEGMTAGAGWIALAIVVFAAWNPWRAIAGAYLFGGVTIVQLNVQALGVNPWAAIGALLVALGALLGLITLIRRAMGAREAGSLTIAGLVATGGILFAAFGGLTGWPLPAQYLSMTPYLATIAVLVVMSADQMRAALAAPASLGRTFVKSG